jgi:hypothetical protein
MLDLDSPRWAQLSHAYGSAEDIPSLIRAIAAEPEPRYSPDLLQVRDNPTPWEEVYSSLCHQYSIYSATYAAFPHIVEIAFADRPEKQIETLVLAGTIRVLGSVDFDVPEDLIPDFEAAMLKVRVSSLSVIQKAELTDRYLLPYLLQAFGGLRHPQSVYVRTLHRLTDTESEVEVESCPQCETYMLVTISADGYIAKLLNPSGHTIEASAREMLPVRYNYEERIAKGMTLLEDSADPPWPEQETANVLAALARQKNDSNLATRILDLDATVICPNCGVSFCLADGLKSGGA